MFCKDRFKFYVFVLGLAFSVICAGSACMDSAAPHSCTGLTRSIRWMPDFSSVCFAQEVSETALPEGGNGSSDVLSSELPKKEGGAQSGDGLSPNAEGENAGGVENSAAPKEEFPKFRKVFVPEEIFSSIPTNGEAYWPIDKNEFEEWLSQKENQISKTAPESEEIFAVSAVYHARLLDQQFLKGTANLQIQSLSQSSNWQNSKSDSGRNSANFIWKISPFSFALQNFWHVQVPDSGLSSDIFLQEKDDVPSAVGGRKGQLESENGVPLSETSTAALSAEKSSVFFRENFSENGNVSKIERRLTFENGVSRHPNVSENASLIRDFLISPSGTSLEFQAKDFCDGGQCRVEFPWSQRFARKENSNLIFELEWIRSADTQWVLELPPQWIPETKDGLVRLEKKGAAPSSIPETVQEQQEMENPEEISKSHSAKDGEERSSEDLKESGVHPEQLSLSNSKDLRDAAASKQKDSSGAELPKEISSNSSGTANGNENFSVSSAVSNPEWNRWRISFGGKTKAVLKLTSVNSPILMENPKSVSQKTIYQIRREGMDVFARMSIASLLDSSDSFTIPVKEICVKMEGSLVPISVRFNEEEVRWISSSHPFSKEGISDSSFTGTPSGEPLSDADAVKTEKEKSAKKISAESSQSMEGKEEVASESQTLRDLPAEVNGRANSSDAVFLTIQLPEPLQGTSNRLEINAIGNLNSWLAEGSGELSPLPRIQLQGALYCENQSQVQVFAPLEILNFSNEDASLTSCRQGTEQSHASLEFQEHSEKSVINLALGRQTAHLSVDQTTAVDFQEHEISAVTELLFSIDSGECFEILGIVDSSWTIDSVESSVDGLVEDWNLSFTPRSVHPVLSDFDPSGNLPEKLTALGWNPDTLGVLKIQLNQSIRPSHPAPLKIRARRLAYSNNFTFSGIQLAPVYFPHCKMGHSWLLCGSSAAWKIHFLEPYREQEIYWSNLSDIQKEANSFKRLESSNSRKSKGTAHAETSKGSTSARFKVSDAPNAGTVPALGAVPQSGVPQPAPQPAPQPEAPKMNAALAQEKSDFSSTNSSVGSTNSALDGSSAVNSVQGGGSALSGTRSENFVESERLSGERLPNRKNSESVDGDFREGTSNENLSDLDSFAIFPTLREAQKHFSAQTSYLTGIQDFKNVPMVRLEHSAQTFDAEIYGFYDIAKNPNATYRVSCTPHGAGIDRIRIMIRPGILLGAAWKFPQPLQGTKTVCLERSPIEKLEDFNSSFELWELIFPQPQREPFAFEVSLMTLHSISGFLGENRFDSNAHLQNVNFLSERERLFEECLTLPSEEQNAWWKKNFPQGLFLPLLDVPDAFSCTGILALKNDIMDSIQTEAAEMVPFLHTNEEQIPNPLESPSKDVLLYRFSPHSISNSPAPTLKLHWRDGNPVFPQAWIWHSTVQSRCFANGVIWHSLTLDIENINSKSLNLKIKSSAAFPCKFLDLEVNKQKLAPASALRSANSCFRKNSGECESGAFAEIGNAEKERTAKKEAHEHQPGMFETPAAEIAQFSLENEISGKTLPATENLEAEGMVYHFEIPIHSQKRHNEITIQWMERRTAFSILTSVEPPEISSNFQILQKSWKVWFPETFVPIRNFYSVGTADSEEIFAHRKSSLLELHRKKTSGTEAHSSALERDRAGIFIWGKRKTNESIFLRIFGSLRFGKNIFSNSERFDSGERKPVFSPNSFDMISEFENSFLQMGWNACESEDSQPVQLLYANSLEAVRWFMLLLTAFLTSWLLKPYRIVRVAVCGISVTLCMLVPLIWTPFFSGIFLGIVLSFIGSSIRRHLSYSAERARPLILVSSSKVSASSFNDETGTNLRGKTHSKELHLRNSKTVPSTDPSAAPSTKTKARPSQILQTKTADGRSAALDRSPRMNHSNGLAPSNSSRTEQTARNEQTAKAERTVKVEQRGKEEIPLPTSDRNLKAHGRNLESFDSVLDSDRISSSSNEKAVKTSEGFPNENFTRKVEGNSRKSEQEPSNFRERHHE